MHTVLAMSPFCALIRGSRAFASPGSEAHRGSSPPCCSGDVGEGLRRDADDLRRPTMKLAAPEGERWVTEQLGELLTGQAPNIAANMQRMATRLELSQQQRAPVDTCARYLHKYAEFLRYDLYLAEGYPIATGVIEGACRYVVKDRMGITGARWSLTGGEAVLRLRALKASGDFDEYWAFHRAREFERNHQALYAHGQVPETATAPRERRKALLRLVP